jgi:protocatechuate 3,4-dioxygenase beta subunit
MPVFRATAAPSLTPPDIISIRTIWPVAYPYRTPHIRCNVTPSGKRALITPMYVFGEKQTRTTALSTGSAIRGK